MTDADMKLFWFDTETTGTQEWKHDIVSIGGLIENGNGVVDEFYYELCPQKPENAQQSAFDVNGFTFNQVLQFDPAYVGVSKMKQHLDDNFTYKDKKDKYILAGYNVPFDAKFLYELWKSTADAVGKVSGFNYYYFHYKMFDVYTIVFMLTKMGKIPVLENMKLETMCKHFSIEHKAHNAFGDITATRDLFYALCKMIN